MDESRCHIDAPSRWGPVPVPPPGHTWEGLMRVALHQAQKGEQRHEIPVGAVVVAADGMVVATAHNAPSALHDPSAHAEVLALRKAGCALGNYRLDGCVLVVTLEPCLMCVGALVHARLAGVVYGAADRKAGAVESCLEGFDLPFHNHRVWHLGGVSGAACAHMLQHFFAQRRADA